MAKKKKKGKPPQSKEPKKKKVTFGQIVLYTVSILMVLSMILPYILR